MENEEPSKGDWWDLLVIAPGFFAGIYLSAGDEDERIAWLWLLLISGACIAWLLDRIRSQRGTQPNGGQALFLGVAFAFAGCIAGFFLGRAISYIQHL